MTEVRSTSPAPRSTAPTRSAPPPPKPVAPPKTDRASVSAEATEKKTQDVKPLLGSLRENFSNDTRADRFSEISRVSQMPEEDRVERNGEINRIYHEQSVDLRDLVGKEGGANWLAYATQASTGVGEVMKGNVKFGPLGASDDTREALGDGNRRVFEEVSPIAERFLRTFQDKKAPWEDFAKTFQPGQDDLKEAFHSYYQAMGTDDKQAKQEAVLKGNLLIGAHEQRRLDPNLDQALESKTGSGLVDSVVNVGNDVMPIDDLKPDSLANGLIKLQWQGFEQPVGDDIQRTDQEHCRDNRVQYYDGLKNDRLKDILDEWRERGSHNDDPNSLSGSNASSWADFDERMYFISELFQNTQMDPGLYKLAS